MYPRNPREGFSEEVPFIKGHLRRSGKLLKKELIGTNKSRFVVGQLIKIVNEIRGFVTGIVRP